MPAFNNPELYQTLYLILAIGLGWIALRFILKLARKILMIGCVSILLLGLFLVVSGSFLGG